jgi:hypothetical protein
MFSSFYIFLELVLIFAELFGFPNKSIYYYLKSIDTELTQYLWPVAVGPSLNKCPKTAAISANYFSTCHSMCLSKTYLTFPGIESSKEGHQCASNFELLSNGSEQAPQQ